MTRLQVLDAITLGLTVLTALEFVGFLALYTRLNCWWRDPLGRALGTTFAIVAAFLVLAIVNRSTQDWNGWPYFRVVMWLLLASSAGYLPYAFLSTRATDRRRAAQEKEIHR